MSDCLELENIWSVLQKKNIGIDKNKNNAQFIHKVLLRKPVLLEHVICLSQMHGDFLQIAEPDIHKIWTSLA